MAMNASSSKRSQTFLIIFCCGMVSLVGLLLTPTLYRAKMYRTLCSNPILRPIDQSFSNQKNSREDKSFLNISLKYSTDKVTAHHYEALYEKYLSKYIGSNISLLEIGLGCGMNYGPGASAHVWRDYLGELAFIHFLEFDRACGEAWYNSIGRKLNVTMSYGSQDNLTVLNNIMSKQGFFDVIIDDGGHSMTQQITSFINLVPQVKPGGLYVIEDLLTSYMAAYGGGYLKNSTTVELIKRLVDDLQTASPQKSITIGDKIRSFELSDEICFFIVK